MDAEWDSLPHVILTGNTNWDPSVLDMDLDEEEAWFDAITDLSQRKSPSAFDEFRDYNKRVVVQSHDVLYSWDTSQDIINACIMVHTYHAQMLDLSCHHVPDPKSTTRPPGMSPKPMRSTSGHLTIRLSCPYSDGSLSM